MGSIEKSVKIQVKAKQQLQLKDEFATSMLSSSQKLKEARGSAFGSAVRGAGCGV